MAAGRHFGRLWAGRPGRHADTHQDAAAGGRGRHAAATQEPTQVPTAAAATPQPEPTAAPTAAPADTATASPRPPGKPTHRAAADPHAGRQGGWLDGLAGLRRADIPLVEAGGCRS